MEYVWGGGGGRLNGQTCQSAEARPAGGPRRGEREVTGPDGGWRTAGLCGGETRSTCSGELFAPSELWLPAADIGLRGTEH